MSDCSCDDEDDDKILGKVLLRWLTGESVQLNNAVGDLSEAKFADLLREVINHADPHEVVEELTRYRKDVGFDSTLEDVLKYRKALHIELEWTDTRKKELLAELGNNYPEEKVTAKRRKKG